VIAIAPEVFRNLRARASGFPQAGELFFNCKSLMLSVGVETQPSAARAILRAVARHPWRSMPMDHGCLAFGRRAPPCPRLQGLKASHLFTWQVSTLRLPRLIRGVAVESQTQVSNHHDH
jgi:hypothetical protein